MAYLQPNLTFTIMNNTRTTAAKMIRQILKSNFPGIKFSVTSERNTVNIGWTDGPTENEVSALTADFKMGSFNGMEDIYEYNNRNEDLPQVQYIFYGRDMSEEVAAKIAGLLNIDDVKSWNGSKEIYRSFQSMSLFNKPVLAYTNGFTVTEI